MEFLVKSILIIFWIFDVLNLPFMEKFDTTYPINTLAWLLIWIFVLIEININMNDEDEDDSES